MRFRSICFLFFIIFPIIVSAEGIANQYEVYYVRVDKNGKGYIKFTSALVNTPPACTQSAYDDKLAFDTNEAGGKAILSLALTAKATGQKIFAKGTGACGSYGVVEDWGWGYAE